MRACLLIPTVFAACSPSLARWAARPGLAWDGSRAPALSNALFPPGPAPWHRSRADLLPAFPAGRPLATRQPAWVPPAATATGISFHDADAYERMTGAWSRLVGHAFLDWLSPAPGLRWLDVGCGSGVFTGLVAQRCAPARLHGIDPEPAQVAYARSRPDARGAQFRQGDATALPYAPASFDVAVMALVLFYLPDPARGVAQMVRVVAPGGLVGAYHWDLAAGGSPLAVLGRALAQADVDTPTAPSAWVADEDAVRQLWVDAGLEDVQTRHITVRREFRSFDALWEVLQLGASTAPVLRGLSCRQREAVRENVRGLLGLPPGPGGAVTCTARAIAVKGRVGRRASPG